MIRGSLKKEYQDFENWRCEQDWVVFFQLPDETDDFRLAGRRSNRYRPQG